MMILCSHGDLGSPTTVDHKVLLLKYPRELYYRGLMVINTYKTHEKYRDVSEKFRMEHYILIILMLAFLASREPPPHMTYR